MNSRMLWAIGSGLMFASIGGCGRGLSASERVEVPDRLTIYSIDGRDHDPGEKSRAKGELFRDYPVLGKVTVEDPLRRKSLIDAFNSGIDASDGTVARCFWPRHGIRAERGGVTTDYVICFECLQFATYRGDRGEQKAIDRSPLARFNEELKRAGVPLAPPAVGGPE